MLNAHLSVVLENSQTFYYPITGAIEGEFRHKNNRPSNLNEICNKILITQRLRPVFHYFFANNLLFNTTIKLLW